MHNIKKPCNYCLAIYTCRSGKLQSPEEYQEKMRTLAEAVKKVEIQRRWFRECPVCDPQNQIVHDRREGLNRELKGLNNNTLIVLAFSFYRPSRDDSLKYVDSNGKINIPELDRYASKLDSSAKNYPNLRDRYEIVMIELENCRIQGFTPPLEPYLPERLDYRNDANVMGMLPTRTGKNFINSGGISGDFGFINSGGISGDFMSKFISIKERALYKESLAHNLVKPDGQRLMIPPPIESYRVVDTTEASQSADQEINNSSNVENVLQRFRDRYPSSEVRAEEAQEG